MAAAIDFTKLKVNELQKELKDRGLDSKGKKDELIKRLQDAVAAGAGQETVSEHQNGQDESNPVSEEASNLDQSAQADGGSVEPDGGNAANNEAASPDNTQSGKRNRDEEAGDRNESEVSEEASKKARTEELPSKNDADEQAATAPSQSETVPGTESTEGQDHAAANSSAAAAGEEEKAEQEHGGASEDASKAEAAMSGEEAQTTAQAQESEDAVKSEAPPPYVPPAEAPPAYPYNASQSAYGNAYSAYPTPAYPPAYGAYPPPAYGAPAYGGTQSVVVEVPNDKVGLVIGKGGCTIKELEQRSGGRIQITPDSAWQGRTEPRPIKIEGTPQQLEWLKQLIAEKVGVSVESLASNATFQGVGSGPSSSASNSAPAPYAAPVAAPGGGVIINVPNESVGLVIGRQGATIKLLEAQTGVKIQIAKECPPQTPNLRPITLIGSQYSIDQARQLIQAKVENKPMPQLEGGGPHGGYPPQSYAPPAYGQPYGYPQQQYPQAYPQYPPAYPQQYDYSQQGYGYYPGNGAPYYPQQ